MTKRSFTRKSTSRKRTYKRKRVMNISRSRQNLIHLKRTYWTSYWVPTTTTTADFWKYFTFQLQYLPNVSEYTNLFQAYKINGIRVKFFPRSTGFDGANNTDTTLPGITNNPTVNMHIVNDPWSTLTPSGVFGYTTANNLFQEGNPKTYSGYKPFSVFFKPTIEQPASGYSSALRRKAPWLLTSSPTVDHYGFHAYAADTAFGGSMNHQAWDILVTYYLSFKGQK